VTAAAPSGWSSAIEQGLDRAIAASDIAREKPPAELIAPLVNAMVASFGTRARFLGRDDLRPTPPLKPGTAFGATWERLADRLLIRSIDPEGSAARVKIEPGDAILEIDDLPVRALSDQMIVDVLSQPIARRTTMLLARTNPSLGRRVVLYGGQRQFEVSSKDGVVLIRFQAFGPEIRTVMAAFREVAREIPPPGVTGIVLDMRGNTGGTVDAAVELASQFLETGPLLMIAGSKMSSADRYPVRRSISGLDNPVLSPRLVVVVNGETASGAEIVAGALQLRQRAVVVGTGTHAMGEVDTIVPLGLTGMVRFTTGRIFLPGIYPLNEIGLAPTVCLAGAQGGDMERTIAAGLRMMSAYAGRARSQLTMEERKAARMQCPASPREPVLDLLVADYLARNEAAYRRALDSLPPNPAAPGE
jgi:carboxyl-terminal processing protease